MSSGEGAGAGLTVTIGLQPFSQPLRFTVTAMSPLTAVFVHVTSNSAFPPLISCALTVHEEAEAIVVSAVADALLHIVAAPKTTTPSAAAARAPRSHRRLLRLPYSGLVAGITVSVISGYYPRT